MHQRNLLGGFRRRKTEAIVVFLPLLKIARQEYHLNLKTHNSLRTKCL